VDKLFWSKTKTKIKKLRRKIEKKNRKEGFFEKKQKE
jgi:hypothetical protein